MHLRTSIVVGALTACAVALALPHAASAKLAHHEIVIDTEGRNSIATIGGFHPHTGDPTLRAALNRFGDPTGVRQSERGCSVRWGQHGVTILFETRSGLDDCDPDVGRAERVYIGGSGARGWHTDRNLYIRSAQSTMGRKYRQQRITSRRYSLVRAYDPFGGAGATLDLLVAGLTDHRVSSFRLYIGAAGE